MLEDIRDHSPAPRPQEIEWMSARPFRALVRVAALVALAVVAANLLVEAQQAAPVAAVACAGVTR